jgi:hypothetical protein
MPCRVIDVQRRCVVNGVGLVHGGSRPKRRAERENSFHEMDMPRENNFPGNRIVATVAFAPVRVAEENASD